MGKSKGSSLVQFIKFGIVGVSNTLVNYIVYIVFVALGAHYLVANTFGFIISVLNAYFLGSRFVFKENENEQKRIWWQVLLKTYAAYFLGYVLNQVFLWVWINLVNVGQYFMFVGDILHFVTDLFGLQRGIYTAGDLSQVLAPIINIFITVPTNFVINKFWAYRQKKIPEKAKVSEVSDDITNESSSEINDTERS